MSADHEGTSQRRHRGGQCRQQRSTSAQLKRAYLGFKGIPSREDAHF